MKPGAVIQARMGSRRLPGKVLEEIEGRPLLGRVVDRLRASRRLEWIGVATTMAPEDRPIAGFCAAEGIACFRGSVDDVLERTVKASAAWALDPVVRITGDAPFVCPEATDLLLDALRASRADYATFSRPTVHEGIDPFSRAYLTARHREHLPAEEREHLALLVRSHLERTRIAWVDPDPALLRQPGVRLSVDEPADLAFARAVYAELGGGQTPFSTEDLLALLERRPDLPRINRDVERSVSHGVL